VKEFPEDKVYNVMLFEFMERGADNLPCLSTFFDEYLPFSKLKEIPRIVKKEKNDSKVRYRALMRFINTPVTKKSRKK
jgi:hypothetical protein